MMNDKQPADDLVSGSISINHLMITITNSLLVSFLPYTVLDFLVTKINNYSQSHDSKELEGAREGCYF